MRNARFALSFCSQHVTSTDNETHVHRSCTHIHASNTRHDILLTIIYRLAIAIVTGHVQGSICRGGCGGSTPAGKTATPAGQRLKNAAF